MNKIEKIFFIYLFFYLLGIFLNLTAIFLNDFRMPVYTQNEINSKLHFTYQDFSMIKVWYLTDIFKLKGLIFSIGDVFIFIFGIAVLFMLISIQILRYRKVY
jgi:hypothetical protein